MKKLKHRFFALRAHTIQTFAGISGIAPGTVACTAGISGIAPGTVEVGKNLK